MPASIFGAGGVVKTLKSIFKVGKASTDPTLTGTATDLTLDKTFILEAATPTIEFKDTDNDDADVNGQVTFQSTDTGTGAENIDFTISSQVDGSLDPHIEFDASIPSVGAYNDGLLKLNHEVQMPNESVIGNDPSSGGTQRGISFGANALRIKFNNFIAMQITASTLDVARVMSMSPADSSTSPNWMRDSTDTNTGIGHDANDSMVLITGGATRLRATDAGVDVIGALTVNGGALPAGGFSLITGDDSDFEIALGSWSTYDDGASATMVDGTGGSPTVLTVARSTTAADLLNGTAVMELTKTAADGQGEGVSLTTLSVPTYFRGRAMQVRMKYKTDSNYVADHYRVFGYDETNTTVLNVLTNNGGDGSLAASATNGSEFFGTIHIPDTCALLTLGIHGTSTDATAFTAQVDDIKIEEITSVNAPIVTEWESFTPTGTWISGNEVYRGQWRRVGDSMEVQLEVNTTGIPTSAVLSVDLPNSKVIDTAKVTDTTPEPANFGVCGTLEAGTSQRVGTVRWSTTTSVKFFIESQSNFVTEAVPHTWNAGDFLTAHFTVPISGWDSGAVLSNNQADLRTLKVHATTVTATSMTNATAVTVPYDTEIEDTHDAYNSSTGVFTAPYAGWYYVSASARLGSNSNWNAGEEMELRVEVDGALTKVIAVNHIEVTATLLPQVTGSTMEYLTAGQTLEISVYQTSGVNIGLYTVDDYNYITITGLPDFSVFGVTGTQELIEASAVGQAYGTAGVWLDHTSIVLTPGTWDLVLQINHETGAGVASGEVNAGISTTAGNSATGLVLGDSRLIQIIELTNGASTPIQVILLGEVVTTTTTYYAKGNAPDTSTLNLSYRFSARRVL